MYATIVHITVALCMILVVKALDNDEVCQMASKMNTLETAVLSLQRLVMCQASDEIKCEYPSDLESRLTFLESSIKNVQGLHGGVNYKRWGRTACPFGSDLLYKGYVAKNAYHSRGGGSNYICLPEDPEAPEKGHPGLQGNSYIHGTEYLVNSLPSLMSYHDNYKDMPCSVCETAGRGQVLMIPAKRTCPGGWTKEYGGYLMAERSISNHYSQSDYICVDEKFEFIPGTSTPQTRAQAMFVEVGCGILPCPPYEEGGELACIVCSK